MPLSRPEYLRRVLIAVGLAFAAVVLYKVLRVATAVLLVLFAGVLLAVFLHGLARWLSSHTPLPRKGALAVVVLLLTALAVGAVWFLGPRVAGQIDALSEQVPQTLGRVEAWLGQFGWGTELAEQFPDSPGEMLPESRSVFGTITTAFSTLLGALANVLIILFIGLYLAVTPSLYVDGVVRLVPPPKRPRAYEVFAALGRALRYWLLGRIASMFVVGALTALGLVLFGVPLALTLGLIAALFSFIPYIGPAIALLPALAVALPEGQVVVVLAIYGAVQLLESYLVTPLIQERAVSMPPALLITAQILLGVLAGAFGVAVATPLAVVAVILVQMLYVEDVLGDEVDVMGSEDGGA